MTLTFPPQTGRQGRGFVSVHGEEQLRHLHLGQGQLPGGQTDELRDPAAGETRANHRPVLHSRSLASIDNSETHLLYLLMHASASA